MTKENWTEGELRILKQSRDAGETYAEIGAALDRTAEACRLRYSRLMSHEGKWDHFTGQGPTVNVKPPEAAPPKKGPEVKHSFELPKPEFGYLPLNHINGSEWIRLGLVADTHLCCKEARLDALHNQYDLFAAEGITTVLHAGNIVDGYVPRINGGSVLCTSVDDQAQYVIDNYPARKDITTYYITGDDHEGWWQKEGFNFGAYLGFLAKDQGRTDLNYIGHVEADVEVQAGSGCSTMIKIQHPGGGSAYARSYAGQKQVEAFQGGEKPAILVQGHYHVSNYSVDRNVHIIGMPGFQDQTIFARKKRLRMEIGGAILEFKTDVNGAVTRCKLEFNLFFDRGYYKPYLQSDKKILKGHLILAPLSR